MTMQNEQHGHVWDSVGTQVALATAAIIAVIVVAWFTVF